MKTIFEIPPKPNYPEWWVIRLEQYKDGQDLFRVTYGKQVDTHLTYEKAALKLGAAIMHDAACNGKLNVNDEDDR